ncbi:MAG: PorT family protein [Elusimicrobia bacterium]|nr:PorT family protein [Elusimicrobiota bacterium]
MKLLFFAVLLLPVSASALGPMRGGVQLGPSTSLPGYDTGSTVQDQNETSFWGGVHAEIALKEPFYIQPELLYAPYEISLYCPSGCAAINPAKYELSYLELPVLLKAKFGKGNFKPYVFAGPNIGFLLDSSITTQINIFGYSAGIKIDLKDATESIKLAGDIGWGVEWAFHKSVSFVADMRYSLGLTEIYKGSSGNKLNGFKGLFGIAFDLKN